MAKKEILNIIRGFLDLPPVEDEKMTTTRFKQIFDKFAFWKRKEEGEN